MDGCMASGDKGKGSVKALALDTWQTRLDGMKTCYLRILDFQIAVQASCLCLPER